MRDQGLRRCWCCRSLLLKALKELFESSFLTRSRHGCDKNATAACERREEININIVYVDVLKLREPMVLLIFREKSPSCRMPMFFDNVQTFFLKIKVDSGSECLIRIHQNFKSNLILCGGFSLKFDSRIETSF